METFKDLIDYTHKVIDNSIHNDCNLLYCDTCAHRWQCFIDNYILAVDYFERVGYYG